jgi:hypothetical protein
VCLFLPKAPCYRLKYLMLRMLSIAVDEPCGAAIQTKFVNRFTQRGYRGEVYTRIFAGTFAKRMNPRIERANCDLIFGEMDPCSSSKTDSLELTASFSESHSRRFHLGRTSTEQSSAITP